MEIIVLGSGCVKCKRLEQNVHQVLAELNKAARVVKEEDVLAMASYGVMRTPGLVINGKLVFSGRLPSTGELRSLIESHSP